MDRETLADLSAFIAVAQARSFTKAAAKVGVSRSALSHTLRSLEARLGIRLLTRTTRSVAPTLAGERLLAVAAHRIGEIETELESLRELRDKPSGTIRITTHEHALNAVLLPRLRVLLARFPDIQVEVVIDYGLTDIVAERFDAGVRSGGQIAKDMIAVRIGPDMRMAVVATPSYFSKHSAPLKPQDLTEHNCINLRLPTYGGLYAWEFAKGRRELSVRVEGQLILNNTTQILNAALDGLGLAYVPEDMVLAHVAKRRLARVLEDWCQSYTGYHLYYPSRRHAVPAFTALVDTLRYKQSASGPN